MERKMLSRGKTILSGIFLFAVVSLVVFLYVNSRDFALSWMYRNRSQEITLLKKQNEDWLSNWLNCRNKDANEVPSVLKLEDWFHARARLEVSTLTYWSAPIVWEGTFERSVLEDYYSKRKITIGLTVFAIGK
uniref:N-acetyllactosaminide alpha-1,3-galactosyltransferase n=1 Tax=Sphenodon punctatus TaxID=8508 RepID=A0A8D0G9M7_SPHPU